MPRKRGRKSRQREVGQEVMRLSFALDPLKESDAIAIKKLRLWSEFCAREMETPVGGWSTNAIIKALLVNLADDSVNTELHSLNDFDVMAKLKRIEKSVAGEMRLLSQQMADIQNQLGALANRQLFTSHSHNSYEQPTQPTTFIPDVKSVSWDDDDDD